jgi:hypothetical protein
VTVASRGAVEGTAPIPAIDPSLGYLAARLEVLEVRVRDAVDRRRASDPDPDDRFRGLYIPDAMVDQLLRGARPLFPPGASPVAQADAMLAGIETAAASAEEGGPSIRWRRLARGFGLAPVDEELLLVALAPDLDPRFERLYAYLQDDVSRRRAGVGLALELATGMPGATPVRARLGPTSPLVGGGLIIVEEAERPFLTRSLRVPDRVAAHLVGDDAADPLVAALEVTPVPMLLAEGDLALRAIEAGVRLVHVRDRPGSAAAAMVAGSLGSAGRPVLALDLARMGPLGDPAEVAAAAARECRLRGSVLLAGPVDVLAERNAGAVRAFAEAPCPVVLVGARTWDPTWARDVPVLIEAPVPSVEHRTVAWRDALGAASAMGGDPGMLTLQFRLGPEQIVRAAQAARQQAAAEDRPLEPADLRSGARAQNAAGLERLARRVHPRVAWDDLVLPTEVVDQLRELASRARFRDVVLDRWGMARASSTRGRGLTALFAGDSGTGKTMSAEVMAGELGLDLYVIDLSTVIDKYVGETEKNLDRIFSEADRVNGVLLFDEADAVFGKRSDVKDSHDRYANVEVAYLLQRMELFDGVAILTTNLRSNLDEAFTRRLDAVVDFPVPDEDDRLRLWERHLPTGVPRAGDLDLPFLARRFRLSGGNVRNVCLAGAYLAAAEDRSLCMADLIHGTAREYQKLGRLCVEAEFGPWYHLVRG